MIKKHDRWGATRPRLAETAGVSDGPHRHQPNNRLRSTVERSNAPYRHSETRGCPAESKLILDNVDKMLGFVPNLHRLMSISPNALSGWATLMGSLAKTLDVKTRDEIALAVSEADATTRTSHMSIGRRTGPGQMRAVSGRLEYMVCFT
ncbi:hypothetical protein [Bradyrhizobium liaoningense]|uniref:hypothetical protein n=1 Tax=Bradyrhizobium liaoningense TaxID=43992 RepID=UPI002011EE49|nr:hypothetical protein [Bradyrhizobium liaoningense]